MKLLQRVFAAAVLCTACAADTKNVSVDAGIAELRIPASTSVDVSWESRDPLNLRYVTHQLAGDESAIVFCAAEGKTYILVSDVIDWDARRRDKTTWIVVVGGGTDDDGGEDDPTPPSPPSPAPNKYGVGPAVHDAMRTVRDRSKVPSVVELMIKHETALNQMSLTAQSALSNLVKQINTLEGWQPVTAALQSSIQAAASTYGMGTTDMKNYIREARLTIEAFK